MMIYIVTEDSTRVWKNSSLWRHVCIWWDPLPVKLKQCGKLWSSEASMAAMLPVEDLWVVTPYSVTVGYLHFRDPRCLHHQGKDGWRPKMGAALISEMFLSYHNYT